jgi:hypothetical protein
LSKKYIARSTELAARALGGEMIIMSAADSSLYTLNEQATLIWDSADGITPLREIVERKICEIFDVAPDIAYRDAEELVDGLAAHGILLVSDQPITAEK